MISDFNYNLSHEKWICYSKNRILHTYFINSNIVWFPSKLRKLFDFFKYTSNSDKMTLLIPVILNESWPKIPFKFLHSWNTIPDYALLIFHVNDNNLYGADSWFNRSNFSLIFYNFDKWSQNFIYEKFVLQLLLFQLQDRWILKLQTIGKVKHLKMMKGKLLLSRVCFDSKMHQWMN